jgi:hypothetical protein
MVMRVRVPLLVAALGLAGCDVALGISDHSVESLDSDGGSSSDADTGEGGPPSDGAASILTPFLGTWSLSGSDLLSNCTNGGTGGTTQTTRQVIFTAGLESPGLIATAEYCTFEEIVSSPDRAILNGEQSCSFSESGISYQQTINTFNWVVSADGTTAQVNTVGIQTNGTGSSAVTCGITRNETATKL